MPVAMVMTIHGESNTEKRSRHQSNPWNVCLGRQHNAGFNRNIFRRHGRVAGSDRVVSKNTNELKIRAPGRFGLEGRRPGSRHGPHLDQNVLAGYATVALASILDPSGGLFSDAARPCQRPAPPLWRKRGTRKSRLETNTENEASSALRARLW